MQCFDQVGFSLDDLHAFAAATGSGLEQHRVADLFGGAAEGFRVLRLAVIAGYQRHAGVLHQRLGGGFAAHCLDGRGGRAEEDQAGRLTGTGKLCILRKEAVAGMDGLCAAGPGGLDQLVRAQVAVGRLGAAEVDADVGLPGMPGVGVDRAVYRDGGQAHGLGGAHHAASDFAAVGDQQGGQHCRGSCVAWEVVPLTLALSPEGRGDDGVGRWNGGI